MTKTLLTMLIILGAAPATETTVTRSEQSVGSGTLVTTTTTTRVTDSPEEIAAKAERAARMLDSLNTSAIPFEFSYTLAASGLGGDTTGQIASFMYSSSPSSTGTRWLAGLGWGSLSFSGRTRTQLRKEGDMLVTEELVEDHKYSYFGFPVRIETALSGSMMSYVQADLNLSAYFGDGEISPLHFGVKQSLPGGDDFLSGGFGKAFVLEFSRRNWRADWRLGESYSLKVKDFPDVEVGASMDVQSFSFPYIFPGAFRPKLGLGAAILSSSIAFLDSENVVQVQDRGGLGVVASGELVYVKTPRLHFVLSGRAYFVEWERVSAPAIVNAGNSVVEESIEPDNGLPISISLGLRISL